MLQFIAKYLEEKKHETTPLCQLWVEVGVVTKRLSRPSEAFEDSRTLIAQIFMRSLVGLRTITLKRTDKTAPPGRAGLQTWNQNTNTFFFFLPPLYVPSNHCINWFRSSSEVSDRRVFYWVLFISCAIISDMGHTASRAITFEELIVQDVLSPHPTLVLRSIGSYTRNSRFEAEVFYCGYLYCYYCKANVILYRWYFD